MNQVWIELEKPATKEDGDMKCKLANRMLERLCDPKDLPLKQEFSYSEHDRKYHFGGAMGTNRLVDKGEWFNLDYFGRES